MYYLQLYVKLLLQRHKSQVTEERIPLRWDRMSRYRRQHRICKQHKQY